MLGSAEMKHLRLYRAIRLIHRHGSIRKAADVLAVSPSALNRSVQAFEEEFGTPVFDRIAGGVRLSSAGELLLDVIDRHLTEHDALLGQISDLRDGLAGHLAVSIGADIGAGLVLDVVAAFEQAHPGVSVEVIEHNGIDALRQRRVGLAVVSTPQTDDSGEVLHSVQAPLGVWCHGDSPADGGKVGLWDIVEGRVLLPPEGTGARTAISHVLRRHHLQEGVTTSVTAAQLWQHMGAQASVAIFPDMVLRPLSAVVRMRRLEIAAGRVQCAILRAARVPMTRPAQALFALLQARLDAGAA